MPDDNEIATHGLVFMLADIGQRWKQTIGYFYTGNSTDGSTYKPLILKIIEKIARNSLCVHELYPTWVHQTKRCENPLALMFRDISLRKINIYTY